jgi:sulfatase modifying factor 1
VNGREQPRRATAILIAGVASVVALVGCEVILGVGSLSDRPADDGGPDATSGQPDAAGADDGGVEAGPCKTSDLRCSTTQPEVCDNGVWVNMGNPCGSNVTCVAGGCTGECGPNQTHCDGQTVQSCDATGHWQNTAKVCPANQTCTSGACTGACGPGETTCFGDVPQTCSASGQWIAGTACAAPDPYCISFNGKCSATPPSCVAGGRGMTDCANGAVTTSCCSTLAVSPGASFSRTFYYDDDGGVIDQSDFATVSPFRLDEYPVTVGRFRQFVGAWNGGAGWTPTQGSGKHAHLNGGQGLVDPVEGGTPFEPGWDTTDNGKIAPTNANLACNAAYATWTSTAGDQEELPITCVNWWEAYAFCIWDGGFLPSEAEWEYAATGGTAYREYPWGSTDPGANTTLAVYDCNYPTAGGTCSGVMNIAPVGSAPAGAAFWGQLDLAGEVYEWGADDYASAYPNPCTNCANLSPSADRVLRGGDFGTTEPGLIAARRYAGDPTARYLFAGVRCARTP